MNWPVTGLLACSLMAAGCVSGGSRNAAASDGLDEGRESASSTAGSRGDAATDRALYSDLIRRMLAQQHYYAALAHIQEQQRLQGTTLDLRYLEAETRRQLGQRDAAEVLYRGLLRSPMAGAAYHGLGLLYADRDAARAIDYLREAVRRQPTLAQARSDLGYALTQRGQYADALNELATAVELDAASDKARNNLVLLLMLSGDEAGVHRVTGETGMTAEDIDQLRRQAQALKHRGNTVRGG